MSPIPLLLAAFLAIAPSADAERAKQPWNKWPCDESFHGRTGIYRYGDEGLTFAKPKQSPGPEYPAAARVERAGGKVVVHAIVAADGTVSGACVAKPHHEDLGFEKAAREAVLRYVYEPAMLDGRPVPVWMVAIVEFKLD